jgi:hypothetical protein
MDARIYPPGKDHAVNLLVATDHYLRTLSANTLIEHISSSTAAAIITLQKFPITFDDVDQAVKLEAHITALGLINYEAVQALTSAPFWPNLGKKTTSDGSGTVIHEDYQEEI